MSQNKTVHINFNGRIHSVTSDAEGFFNLNLLHTISVSPKSKRPNRWLENKSTKELVVSLGQNFDPVVKKAEIGEWKGYWGTEEIIYAYAAWLNSDFHAAIVAAFTALANNDVKKAKEIVRTAVRVEGIPVRKEVASKIMKYGDKTFIGDMTDAVNLYVTGKTAKGIRATRTEGFNKSTPTRDRMTDSELKAITAIEALVALQIERDENKSDWMGRSSVRELINNTGNTVRSMIQ